MKNLAPDIQCQALSEYANRRSKDTLNNPPAYFMSLLQVYSLSLISHLLYIKSLACAQPMGRTHCQDRLFTSLPLGGGLICCMPALVTS